MVIEEKLNVLKIVLSFWKTETIKQEMRLEKIQFIYILLLEH